MWSRAEECRRQKEERESKEDALASHLIFDSGFGLDALPFASLFRQYKKATNKKQSVTTHSSV